MRIAGGCHCGNIELTYETELELDRWPIRACQCGFCRAHGVRTTSDPDGRVSVSVRDPSSLSRYRHGSGCTDFLVCARCGVYVGATIDDDAWMVINVNVLRCRAELDHRTPEPKVYDEEPREERLARRRESWTPSDIELGCGSDIG